ncbi:hypothetical protein NP493_143g02004 [Ridgeia piscesae]|uniref:ANK_REP_REGION domain-containing protein n=1 Tax=Ridgeia piscesae TaxID=27915 RepID=A0AAD9P4S3_RIDPI|nr:hypothetical protein NP493_143g02004 [Ridgeia piscesae]
MAPYSCYNLIVLCVSHVIISCLTLNNCSRLINSQTCAGVTATYLAAQQGHLEVLRYLVEEGGASLKILCHDRRSCLQAAAQTGQLETIQWLVTCKKLDVNDRDFDGATALHFAVGQGHAEVVEWLLQNGGKMTRDSTGGTLLHTAVEQGHLKSDEDEESVICPQCECHVIQLMWVE